ncbi:MAG: response regulator [Inquilinus sp.]|nr:response regulator [Inquilinus sp.]
MTRKLLLVDDDPNLLSGMRRQLARDYELSTAAGGKPGLETLAKEGPFAVVISDMRMPEMDGVEFLREVKRRHPDTVRIMLTGNADQQTAIDAVNEGSVFRFHNKPCPVENLKATIEAALEHYRLITAERLLLEQTLAGSIKVLVDVLSILDPEAFGKTVLLRERVKALAGHLKLADAWQLDIAAMLSSIGQITLPAETQAKIRAGSALSSPEKEMVDRTPENGRNLLANIPRLEKVGNAIYYQNRGYDGTGFPDGGSAGPDIPIGGRILRVLLDLERLETRNGSTEGAFAQLECNRQFYDPGVLAAAHACIVARHGVEPALETRDIPLDFLRAGDVLVDGIRVASDTLLLPAEHVISQTDIERLRNKRLIVKLVEPIGIRRRVAAPAQEGPSQEAGHG